jgi:carbon storage regulator CsrA
MLVLTRKAKQKIVIGHDPNQIVITICWIQGDKVSIGIEADKEMFPVARDDAKKSSRKEIASQANNEYETEVACDSNKDAFA